MSIGEDRIAARNVERAMMIMVAAMLLLPAVLCLIVVLVEEFGPCECQCVLCGFCSPWEGVLYS